MSCDRRNPLVRTGTAQPGRRLEAFDPLHFRIDDRGVTELVSFGRRYSEILRFHEVGEPEDTPNTWLPIFGSGAVATMAALSELPIQKFVDYRVRLEHFLLEVQGVSNAELRQNLRMYFHLPLLLLREADLQLQLLAAGHPLQTALQEVVASEGAAFGRWVAVYKGIVGEDPPLFEDADLSGDFFGLPTRIDELRTKFSEPISVGFPELVPPAAGAPRLIAKLAPSGWANFYAAAATDATPVSGATIAERVRSVLSDNLLQGSIRALFKLAEEIRREADRSFEAALQQPGHEPAYGLYLAFVQLFRNHQAHLNGFTERHRDHYYRDVLQVAPRTPDPDRMHLVLEAPKTGPASSLVAKGTSFDAGRDAEGRDIAFELEEDFVLNRGKVAQLTGVFASRDADDHRVFRAAPDVTLADDEALAQWRPFGSSANHEAARLGLAFADPILFAREGARTITVVIGTLEAIDDDLPADLFRAKLSGEEEWIEAAAVAERADSKNITVTIKLESEVSAIVPYDETIHQLGLKAQDPALQLLLNSDCTETERGFDLLAGVHVESATIQVSASGLRNVQLQNDGGVADTSKPFDLLGPLPVVGSSFQIGSSEALTKPLASLSLSLTWETAYRTDQYFRKASGADYKLEVDVLAAGDWTSLPPDHSLFGTGFIIYPPDRDFNQMVAAQEYRSDREITVPQESAGSTAFENLANQFEERLSQTAADPDLSYWPSRTLQLSQISGPGSPFEQTLENPVYAPTSSSGFVRFRLVGKDFGHAEYPQERALSLIEKAKWNGQDRSQTQFNYNYDSDGQPHEPYTPRVTSLRLSYTSQAIEPKQLFELHPFGIRLARAGAEEGDTPPGAALFRGDTNDGELYIGIENFEAPANLNLLVRVAEGTSDPSRTEPKLVWQYLGKDGWDTFEGAGVDDRTRNLTTTGVISIPVPRAATLLPEEADREDAMMPRGLHWLRVSAESQTDALADILDIKAQGVSARFAPQRKRDLKRIGTPVAGGTVSRPKPAQRAIKKVIQPGASFGGRSIESPPQFSQRVSERLRHKNRALTMWDYERLLLDHFPDIYKVKCINHTRLERNSADKVIAENELCPGHVLVVPIPHVDPETGNPRRPFARKKTLAEMKEFLARRTSPFVEVDVQVPRIEEIQMRLQVQFAEGIDDVEFYLEQLNSALIEFLTPWAGRERADVAFGGRWHKSSVINFIEEKPYVAYIQDVEMFHRTDIAVEDDAWDRVDLDVAQASVARSVLVSHEQHDLSAVGDGAAPT